MQEFRGQEEDLSGFGVDPELATAVVVSLRDSGLTVKVNEQIAFRQNLSRLPGRIVGARWVWPEAGRVIKFKVL